MVLFLSYFLAFFTIAFGVFVWLNNRHSTSNRLFLLLAIEFSLWSLFTYFSLYADNSESALFFVRMVMLVTSPVWATLYLLCLVYPTGKLQLKKWQKIGIIMLMVSSMVVSLTPYMFSQVKIINSGEISFTSDWGIIFYLLNILIFLPSAIRVIYLKFRYNQGLVQLQFRYVSIALSTISIILVITNVIAAVIFNNSSLGLYGTWVADILMLTILSYPILQQHLYSTNFVASKIIYYLTLSALAFLVMVTIINSWDYLNERLDISTLYFCLIVYIIAVVVAIVNISSKLNIFLERYIINHGLNIDKLKHDFIISTNNQFQADQINKKLFNLFETVLGTKGEAITFFTDRYQLGRKAFFCQNNWESLKHKDIPIHSLKKYFDLNLNQEEDVIIFEEAEVIQKKISKVPNSTEILNTFEEIKIFMKKEKIAVIFPLISDRELRGWLFLREKKNQIAFYLQDIEFVQKMLGYAIFKIDSAYLYQLIKQFNKTLQTQINIAIADKTEAYKKLQRAYYRLSSLDQMKSEFVSITSHELRTPATIIQGYLISFLKEFSDKLPPKAINYINISLNAANRNLELVKNMLTLSRIESGRYKVLFSKIDLNQLVLDIATELKQAMTNKKKNIPLKCELPKENIWISGETNKIHEVIGNLVENAYKFTDKGSVTIRLSKLKNNEASIDVIDTGIGIEEENINKIFGKFARITDGYAKLPESGTGIGLYISRQIIRKHHGRIKVTSTFGKGSTFSVILPIVNNNKIN